MKNLDLLPANWLDLQNILFKDCYDGRLNRHRSNYVMRGLSDKSFDLKTSLMRLGGNVSYNENHLIRNFKRYADKDAILDKDIWSILTLAQHHGLPTRLLDWTFSPYVALHFATAERDKYTKDGVIWCVDFIKVKERLPKNMKKILDKENALAFTAEMLSENYSTLSKFDKCKSASRKAQEFVAFFEPPSLDSRVINQFALLSVMPGPELLMDTWLSKNEDLYYKIIIPHTMKWEIRDKLDQANITERVIFPGLDGLCTWLKRWYSQK